MGQFSMKITPLPGSLLGGNQQSGGLFARRRRKHGGPKRRVWRKIHLGINEETLEIRAVEVTSSDIGDAPMLPDLLAWISTDQDIASVTAPSHGLQANRCRATDGAYDTRKCHDAIAERDAAAIIPPRKNGKPWKTVAAGTIALNEALRASKYLGRALWRRWSGHHRRSRVETKMHCVKLLDQRLMARDVDRPNMGIDGITPAQKLKMAS